MNIDIYACVMTFFYMGLFILSFLTGIVCLWKRIRQQKSIRHGVVIPCLIYYSFVAGYNLFIPYIAYDDRADPNYWKYKGWEFRDFLFNDIRMLLIWLFIGALVDFIVERKKYRETTKKIYIAVLIFLAVAASAMQVWSFANGYQRTL